MKRKSKKMLGFEENFFAEKSRRSYDLLSGVKENCESETSRFVGRILSKKLVLRFQQKILRWSLKLKFYNYSILP